MEHISKIKWQYDFTGSDGTVSPHEMAIRTLPLTRSMASGQTIGFPSDGSRPPNNFKAGGFYTKSKASDGYRTTSRRVGFTQRAKQATATAAPIPGSKTKCQLNNDHFAVA
jgi:hypothetical protein